MKQIWRGSRNFDVYIWVIFDCYCQSLISATESELLATAPTNFNIFLKFLNFERT